MEIFEWIIHVLRDPGEIIRWGGYPALALVIFAETGALAFFLPGDSLLVVTGLYAAKGDLNIFALNALLIPMAIIGDATSYWIGSRTGKRIFNKPKSRFFNPDHVLAAHAFYERHGGKAIILARFMPIVRTFVPVVAGVAGMSYPRFATYNIVGGAAWVGSMTLTGYVLATRFPWIGQHIEKIILLVVFVSILPGIIAYLRAKYRARLDARMTRNAPDLPTPPPSDVVGRGH